MADYRPIKANLTSGNVTSLGEVPDGDSLPVALGGTGATTAAGARTALGAAALNGDPAQPFSMASLNGGPLAGFRNKVINGDMRIAQVGSVAAVGGAYTYGGPDMMCASVNGTLVGGTLMRLTGGPSVGESNHSFAVGDLTVSTAGQVVMQTRMEAANTRRLNGKKVTISCKVYQDTGSSITLTASLVKPTSAADTFSAMTTLQNSPGFTIPTNTLTSITFTTTTLGAADASLGLAAMLNFPFGAAISNKYFCVTDWQVEEGSVATPFEQRLYELELMLCQRHFRPVFLKGAQVNTTTSFVYADIYTMRVTPVFTPGTFYIEGVGTPSDVSVSNITFSTNAYYRVAVTHVAAGAVGLPVNFTGTLSARL